MTVAPLLLVPAVGLAYLALRAEKRPPGPEAAAIPAPRPTATPTDPSPPAAPPPAAAPAEQSDVSAKMARALEIRRTDPKGRRRLLREVLAEDPNHVPALESLSLALLHDENHLEAKSFADRCLALEPGNETCRMVANYALPKTAASEAFALGAALCLKDTPDDAKCLATNIGHDVLLGKTADAKPLLERLMKVAPGEKQTLLAKARIESTEGDYENARRDLDGACRQGMEQACFRADALREEGW
ncbi:MAG TPA: hypothetical protein VHE30_20955 [Polyangiaceae bacterium]|nr:hypothetical protein [Polyangiaceae bacterium]